MIHPVTRLLSLALLTINLFGADSPQSGSISGNTYHNSFFHLTCTFPDGWKLESTPPSVPEAETFELFRAHAPTPGQSFGFSAQEMLKSSTVTADLSKYLDSLVTTLQPKGWQANGERGFTGYGGLGFREQGFIVTSGGTKYYASIAVTTSHGYILRLSLTAASPESLADLIKLAEHAITFQPDFGPLPDPPPASSATPVRRIRVSSGVAAGNLEHKVQPSYPMEAKKQRAQGMVVLEVIIGTDGQIKQIYALEGHPLLIPAAIDAVKQWRYKPYLLNGQVVEVGTTINVIFTLSPF
jgi:TonB family protein